LHEGEQPRYLRIEFRPCAAQDGVTRHGIEIECPRKLREPQIRSRRDRQFDAPVELSAVVFNAPAKLPDGFVRLRHSGTARGRFKETVDLLARNVEAGEFVKT